MTSRIKAVLESVIMIIIREVQSLHFSLPGDHDRLISAKELPKDVKGRSLFDVANDCICNTVVR